MIKVVELTLATLLDKAWVLIGAWFWYDKRQRDNRLDALETRQIRTYSEQQITETKIDALKELFESKIQGVRDDTAEIKRMLNARRSE